MREDIRTLVLNAGFDAVGFASATIPKRDQAALNTFIENGHHGTMDWMARRVNERGNPKTLWPDVRSVIVCGLNYGPAENPMGRLDDPDLANISVYAENKDYHDVVKKRLKAAAREIVRQTDCEVKVFVDTAPVLERALAAQSGIGWQGKHSNLVSRGFGSWLFLGEIFTTLEIEPDPPETDHCGNCRACLDICPTQAITAPYKVNARACISYLTIEHDGPIPEPYRKAMGNRVYGCDDCLAICPWNKFAVPHDEPKLAPKEVDHRLGDYLAMDEEAFRAFFSGSPVKRIKHHRFMRNLCIAAGNSGNKKHVPQLERLKASDDKVVSETAAWAIKQLGRLVS